MNSWWKLGVRAAFLYVCWFAMQATHEAGHVLHAWLSGGQVAEVILPWFDFSRTDLAHNPHPLFVAWGGALWGCLIPLALLASAVLFKLRLRTWVQFLAGFCLVANGAYLGAGSLIGAGDAGDLMRYGVPQWALVAVGTPGVVVGLFLWHRLGLRRPARGVMSDAPIEDTAGQ